MKKKTERDWKGKIEITFTRVNWGGGGDYGRAVGVVNSAAATVDSASTSGWDTCGTNNNNNNCSKSDGSSGDREHTIPVASVDTMAAAVALSGMSRSMPQQ